MARIAKSLDTLRSQINAAYPNRKKTSDGWIGDAAHAARRSDHNENAAGVVQALDITHDPAHGLDAGKLAETLLANRDPRIKYIISNRRISTPQWTWKAYTGANAHTQHVHISVSNDPAKYDDPSPWKLGTASSKPPPSMTPVVVTMKNTYDEALRRLLADEGGYSNHPNDPGGPTNFGITLTDYRKYINPNGTAANVRAMSVDQAKKIYKEKYWNAMNCDNLPAGVDYAVFDYGVNSGIGRSPKVLQRIVGVEPDGKIGPATIAATRAKDPKMVINAICDERMKYLKGLRIWPTFGKGWTRRVTGVRAAALRMAGSIPAIKDMDPANTGTGTTVIVGTGTVVEAARRGWSPTSIVIIAIVAVIGAFVVYWLINKVRGSVSELGGNAKALDTAIK